MSVTHLFGRPRQTLTYEVIANLLVTVATEINSLTQNHAEDELLRNVCFLSPSRADMSSDGDIDGIKARRAWLPRGVFYINTTD